MPVGMFKPEAKTDTVNPAGTVMSSPLPGAKMAVSAGQSGLCTVAAVASLGAIKPGPTRPRVIRDNRRESDFIAVLSYLAGNGAMRGAEHLLEDSPDESN